ncbi:hypothetical protein CU254_42410 (plasmid) [Amycolatopsis sp. AA4]|nr:hypothetical protein CU254_42410 [Amycolatopsis sp. AA4]EFL12700.1 predicted protein [Streptomyces sp. AA4]
MLDHQDISPVNRPATSTEQPASNRQTYSPEREALGVVATGIELVDPPPARCGSATSPHRIGLHAGHLCPYPPRTGTSDLGLSVREPCRYGPNLIDYGSYTRSRQCDREAAVALYYGNGVLTCLGF